MGFKYSYSSEDIMNAIRIIRAIKHDVCDPKLDGFTAWGAKQDLYRLKWMLVDLLKDCPTFGPEEEWLREQEQTRIIRYLRDE